MIADISSKLAICNFNFLEGSFCTDIKFRSKSEEAETALFNWMSLSLKALFSILMGFNCPSKKHALFSNCPSLRLILNLVL